VKKNNKIFGNASVILICGPSSAGKSTLANLICELCPNFLKLNTKEININSEIEFSSLYFSKYLDQATKIINRKIYRINEIIIEQKKQNNKLLNYLYNSLLLEFQGLSEEKFLKILYQNYFKEVETILAKGNKCIIDHNIFLDPFPIKKNIFLEFFKVFENDFKIINIYSNFENILLNTLERNKRFYHFLSNNNPINESTNQLIESDIKKGFSYYIFRQPLRTIENLSLLFKIDKNSDGKILQSIPAEDFKKMLTIVKYEQQKLIGFLVFKKYIFTHIEDKELIEFRCDFAYINEISDNQDFLFIKEKRFLCDFQIITNCNLREEDTNKLNLNKKLLDLRNEINSFELKYKINSLINNIELNKSFSMKNFEIKTINNLNNDPLYIISSFSQNDLTIVENIIKDITERIGNRLVLYPVAENIFIKILINNENINFIKIIVYFFEGLNQILKKFEDFDNNLIFLSKLYAGLKLNNKFNNIKFKVIQN
jgi:energy-coupling factor transporter ATP-binding protein EcfA2